MPSTLTPAPRLPSLPLIAAMTGYLGLICYGSLYPFHGWQAPTSSWWEFLVAPPPRFITRTDLTTNVLAYVPLGLLSAAALAPYMRVRAAVLCTLFAGVAVSFAMELLQLFVPNRVASNLDIVTNGLGALLGGLLFRAAQSRRWPGRVLFGWRERWFEPGRLTELGLLLIALWVLAQFSLDLPSLLAGNLHKGFTPYWVTLGSPSRFDAGHALIYALEIASLGLFLLILLKPGRYRPVLLSALLAVAIAIKFVAAAALVKFSILARLVSLEVLIGIAAGLAFLPISLRRESQGRAHGLAIASLLALAGVKAWWAPFPASAAPLGVAAAERMLNITGLAAFTSALWPYLVVLFLSLHWAIGARPVR